jgi:hypothetical protein
MERLPDWQRGIPVGFRFVTRNGGDAVLSSIEFWSDGVMLHFGFQVTTPPLADPDGHSHRLGPEWFPADDIETTYHPVSSGAGESSPDLLFGRAEFRPAVPESASTLYVSNPELLDTLAIPL